MQKPSRSNSPFREMKVAIAAIVGRTNAGKSTLVNRLVGEKVSIVSSVEQTTRNMVRGIVADERGQLVLLDTPGLHKAVGELGRALNRIARRTASGADILCVVFDASSEVQLEDTGWMQRVAKEKPGKLIFVLNKADRAGFSPALFHEAWEEVKTSIEGEEKPIEPVWVESVATEEGGEKALLDALFNMAEEGELLFPEDVATDYPRRLAIADSIREKFLRHLHQEIPHEFGVLVKNIDEREGPLWAIDADLIVNRPSQKPIVIGRAGATIKAARLAAQREISDMFGVKAKLELWVRVEPNWMKNPKTLAAMGYV